MFASRARATRACAARRRWPALALALALSARLACGCFSPRRPDCVVSCGAHDSCPSGMTCSAGLCTAGASCISSISAGETHTCAARAGAVYCWGGNLYGQLGSSTTEAAGQATPRIASIRSSSRPVTAVAAGGKHTCALGGGQVVCWGDNAFGQLGTDDSRSRLQGDTVVALNGRATALAAGLYHTCALLEDQSVRCWGDNRFGQLGTGASDNLGGWPHGLASAPPLNLGGAVERIVSGAYHTCALLDGGEIKCWGWNDYAQLGLGDLRSRGRAPEDMGAALPPVSLGAGLTPIDVAAGAFHSCAVVVPDNAPAGVASGAVKCWGANSGGRLARGDSAAVSIGGKPNDLGDALPTIDLGAGRSARRVVAGAAHTCALLDDFSVRCWGYGADGELGTGDGKNRGDVPSGLGDRLPRVALGASLVADLTAGANHTCAVRGAAIVCWGLNKLGQLGIGDFANRGDTSTPPAPVVFSAP